MTTIRRFTLLILGTGTLLGVANGQVPQNATPVAPAAPPPIAVPTPEPSPPPVAVGEEADGLRRDLTQVINATGWRNAHTGVLVVSLEHGDTLFSLNPDLPVAPASNMKLFSTAAALYYLGPNFRYSTYALADGEIRDGVLHGDVVLYGTGDPAMSSRMLGGMLPPLRALADSLLANGIREVQGDVVGDGSYFDGSYIAEGWREGYRLASYSAPIGALSLGENIVSIRVLPGASGQPAVIRTSPPTDGLLVQNRVRTVGSGQSTVRFAYDPAGLIIEGQIARGHPGVARTVPVVDPANYAAAAFRNVLEAAGIRVSGQVRTVSGPEGSSIGRATRGTGPDAATRPPPRVLATHLSPTLAEVTSVTNHVSQNLFAEALFKTVGRVALGDGSFAGGARAVQYFLECEQPIGDALQLVDGSGLSPLNRVTARATVHLLDLMTRTDVWDAFFASLPEAASPEGGSHSLRNRMGQSPAARNLRAKTGTINGVSSLSGYVRAANGELLAFSIYGNELPSTARAKRMEDAIGIRLARFTRSSPVPVIESETEATTPSDPAAATPDAGQPEPVAASAPPPEPAAPAPRTHRVARGETLDGIAKRYGVTVAEIQRLNPRLQPRQLQIGQTVTLPR